MSAPQIVCEIDPSADGTMRGLEEALEAIDEVVSAKFPKQAGRILRTQVSFLTDEDPAPLPTIPVRSERCGLLWLDRQLTVEVKQQRWGSGRIKSAGMTELFHEFAEHVVPFVIEKDWNESHVVKWIILTHDIASLYRKKMRGKAL